VGTSGARFQHDLQRQRDESGDIGGGDVIAGRSRYFPFFRRLGIAIVWKLSKSIAKISASLVVSEVRERGGRDASAVDSRSLCCAGGDGLSSRSSWCFAGCYFEKKKREEAGGPTGFLARV